MKKFMKMSGILFLALILVSATVVAVDAGKTALAATAKTLKMKKKKATVTVGKKITLKVTVKPKKATIKWSTNKKQIATVSKKGVVTGKKKGTATITAKSGKKKATCKVTVQAKKSTPNPTPSQSPTPQSPTPQSPAPQSPAPQSPTPSEPVEPGIQVTDTLKLDESKTIDHVYDTVYYAFTPSENGDYTLNMRSSNGTDYSGIRVDVYDSSDMTSKGSKSASMDTSGWTLTLKMENLTAGKTYYLAMTSVPDPTSNITATISKTILD